jgi:RsmE family RNA methyltransferase
VNLLLLAPGEIVESTPARAVLRGRRAAAVRALGVATIHVGVERGPTGTARVAAAASDEVVLELTLDGAAPAPPGIQLILAVPRPKALARVVQAIASFGVGRIDLVNAWRVDKSYLGSHVLAPDELREALVAGCEQGAHTWLPDVAVHPLFVPFVESLAPPSAAVDRIVASPRAEPIERVLRPGDARPVVVAVGPEGGWIDAELGSLARAGFAPASLGASTLRTEVAISALLGQLLLWRRVHKSPVS